MPAATIPNNLRVLIATLIMVATILLAIGERSVVLPLTTLLVLGVSAYVTDYRGWFRLKQSTADLLALGVVAASAVLALRTDRYGLLVSVANLQSYLQYVVLFQAKTPRVYWQLALLSLGQVAIASTLVPGPAFGLMLLLYLLVGLLTFAGLSLHLERSKLRRSPDPAVKDGLGSSRRRPLLRGSSATRDEGPIVRRLFAPACVVVLFTALGSATLFFALPRWNVANFTMTRNAPLRTVGFSNTVLLGELGEVIDNPDLVMRIQFFRGRGNTPMQLENEPLLRGAVVSRYEDRKWSNAFQNSPANLPTDAQGTIVRQRISVEPLDVSELFCVFPVFALEEPPDGRLRLNRSSDQLYRLDEFRSQSLEFEVGTTGITGNRQREVVPCHSQMHPQHVRSLEAFSSSQFAGLQALAERVLAEQGIDAQQDRAAAARALSRHFGSSGEFMYSISPQQRDEQLDPLEDFVTTHRAGHCEYFAGALVMMLRSQNIPARMAIGYKGGEWNPLGMYYQVQQLHAHAWVEAYLQRDQVPLDSLSREDAPNGAWLILDPTEGVLQSAGIAHNTGFLARVRQSLDYARVLWINYVASLNSKRQRRGIYVPLAAGAEAAVNNLTSRQLWAERQQAVENSILGEFWRWYRRHWFSWRGGLVAIGFSLFIAGAFFGARALASAIWGSRWLGQRQHTTRTPVLEMYRRLEAVLRRAGLDRLPAQTAREFAVAAGGHLSERAEYRRVAHLPRRVVDSFYRVRFGRRALDNQEAKAVELALKELERTLPHGLRR